MALAAGIRLGPYEILGLIGAGGMGEVYKARDTRLDRTVAIKVLPSEISSDSDRRARFEREAHTIATLSHPHICTLHDVGEHASSLFLVMEHLEGQTLAERLRKGPLPIEQALEIGSQMAEALSAAHRQGIVHRDLKPANVMLTKSGAKLLDFGLAKLTGQGEQEPLTRLMEAPTRTTPLTGQGAIVGTLQYMAPEQLEGRPADARTDLWALGTVIYEMVAGQPPFVGSSAASLIGAILERNPLPLIAPQAPPRLDGLVRRCLSKSADDRPDTAHDIADELRWMRNTTIGAATARQNQDGAHLPRWAWRIGAALVLGGVLLLAFLLYWERERNRNLRDVAAEAFYQMRALDADLVELRARGAASSNGFARASHRRATLEQEYDRYLDAIGLYARKSPTERAVMRMARRLGETDLQVPPDFYESAMTVVAAWRKSAPSLRGALDRARERDLLHKIRWALDKYGLPREFMFIALQESRFETEAVGPPSPSGVPKGLWQFIPERAVRYGLKLGPLVALPRFDPLDERHDAERSTEAAARLLADIYWSKAAGSALLVIASYTLGDRVVVDKLEGLPNDPRERSFWNLRKHGWLPSATSEYVMSVFATALICEQPEVFEVQMKPCY